tara:strand:- start:1129 stop:1839 length:711 start_codon:yes stop_codon:yes gene_type:complete
MQTWKQIWLQKSVRNLSNITLQDLIVANGFNTGVGSYNAKNWRIMVADFCQKIALQPDCKILELGCGSGAFLYAINEIYNVESYGIDYSESLIEVAKAAIPKGKFKAHPANQPSDFKTSFDIIFSHSVFFYFPDHEYVEKVISTWTKNLSSGGMFALMDLPDEKLEDTYHRERMKAYRDPSKYADDYKDLRHLFFNKESIIQYLESIGMENVQPFPHAVTSYGNARFRFNIICTKP